MNTKRILADSLEGLLRERPLGEITVQDITAASGLSRSTFYKHFEDKYDLVGWMLPADRLFELASSVDGSTYDEVMVEVLNLIEEWRPVYANAVNDPYEELVYGKILSHTNGFYQLAFSMDANAEDGKIESIVKQLAIKQINDFLLSWVMGKINLSTGETLEVLKRLWPEELFR